MVEVNDNSINRLATDAGYKDKTVLLTGGTGFVGKVLLEKLLRTCPLVKMVYMMIRVKKGMDPQERLDKLFSNPLFDLLKETRGVDIFKKVAVIPSDILQVDLGLTEEHRRKLVDEVEIIFHAAASVRFDEPLKAAVIMNVRGTKLMLDLAKECKNLSVFSHLSTSYCHDKENVLYERTYPSPADPHAVIQTVEWMNDEAIAKIEETVLKTYPNTYAFSKALGEGLVADEMNNLPAIILRTSMVYPIFSDPIPGWIDNINGVIGISAAAAKGVLKVFQIDESLKLNFVPVDVVANMFMLATFDFLCLRKRRVYHCTYASTKALTWKECNDPLLNVVRTTLPLNNVLSYPYTLRTNSWVLYKVLAIFFHFIPALFLDCIIFLTGNKPLMWRLQKKLSKGIDVVSYYTTREWSFNTDEMDIVRNGMTDAEKAIYIARTDDLQFEKYAYDSILGTRLYIFNESNDTIPAARRHLKIMLVFNVALLALFAFGFLYAIARRLHCIWPCF